MNMEISSDKDAGEDEDEEFMLHQMRNCNNKSAYTILILESTDQSRLICSEAHRRRKMMLSDCIFKVIDKGEVFKFEWALLPN